MASTVFSGERRSIGLGLAVLLGVFGSVAAVSAQQVEVSNADRGLVRLGDFYNGFDLQASTSSFSSTRYHIDGYGMPPQLFSSPGDFMGDSSITLDFSPRAVPIRVNKDFLTGFNRPPDLTDFDVNNYVVFTPPNNGAQTYINVTAHVVAPELGYNVAGFDALSKQTIPYGATVTVPVNLTNSTRASDGTDASRLTVSRQIVVGGSSGHRNGNNFIFDASNSEVVLNGAVNSSTFVLDKQALNSDYSISITPQRDATHELRNGVFYVQSDASSPFGTLDSSTPGHGFSYFVPAIVPAHSTQTVTGLGGAGNGGGTGGVNAAFTSNAGGDFSVNYASVDPASLPPGGNFQIAGNSAQRWDISYTGSVDGTSNPNAPITLTFAFDRTDLPDVDLSKLRIEHFNSLLGPAGEWETLPVVSFTFNTITVTTTSFSPFVLSVVPEPVMIAPAAMGAASLLLRRRSRRIVTFPAAS